MLIQGRKPLAVFVLLAATLVAPVGQTARVSADAGDVGQTNRAVAARMSVGNNHACYVASGLVYCWGSNNQGQLGQDHTEITRSATPLLIPNLTGVTQVAAGANHTCILKSDGSVHCFGASGPQIGNNSSGVTYQPLQVISSGATSVTAGGSHSCAVLTGGEVRCWGSGWNGQLGDGSTSTSHTPVRALSTSEPAVAVSAGDNHTCALMVSSGVTCWGNNMSGQVGNGSFSNQLSPAAVELDAGGQLTGAVAVSAGNTHSCAVTGNGGAFCWGANMYQELGSATAQGGSNNKAHAVRASRGSSSPISDAAGISAGTYYTCLLRTSGAAACFGQNDKGQIGNGESGSQANQGPETVANVSSALAVTTGLDSACAVTASTIWCWGNAASGRLGNGLTSQTNVANAGSTLPFLAQTVTFGSLSDDAIGTGSRTVSATSSSTAPVTFSSVTTGVCTVSGTTVTYVAPGTCTVRASRGAFGMFTAATDVDRSFSISGTRPTARTSTPTSVSGSRATFNAVVNPSGMATTVKFVYGLKADLSDATEQTALVQTSMNDTDVSFTATGLAERTRYYYRVVATNSQGTSSGDIVSFVTLRPVGVSVNDAAEFTNSRSVTVFVTGTSGSVRAILSNDGGFSNSKTFDLVDNSAEIPWTLVASRDERLPKVVYVKFVSRLGSSSTPYQDDIILDTTAPTMTSATGTSTASSPSAVTAASSRGGVRLQVRASDRNSGIGKVQVRTSAGGRITDVPTSSPRATSRTVRVNTTSKRLWVRVVDRAGNNSKWTRINVR